MQISTEFRLGDAVAVLTRTPAVLDALLRGLPATWVRQNEGPDTWTPFDIVGHLAYAERTDWIPRVRCILQHGVARAFEPFDRLAQFSENQDVSIEVLLDYFVRLRRDSLSELTALNLQEHDLSRHGTHPELGSVTLGQLLATWVVHDLTHLHQLTRVMASQYTEAVGPWSSYLGVLRCKGHSD